MADVLTVLTTTDNEREGELLAQEAVALRLAACAQISGPVTSVYWWEGVVDTSREWQVLFKTTRERYAELEAYLLAEHSYDKPEVIAMPVTDGSADYLDWVAFETSAADR